MDRGDVFRRRLEPSHTILETHPEYREGTARHHAQEQQKLRGYDKLHNPSRRSRSSSSSDYRPHGNFPSYPNHVASAPSSESTHHSFHPSSLPLPNVPPLHHPLPPPPPHHPAYGISMVHSPSFESNGRCPTMTPLAPIAYSYGGPPPLPPSHLPSGYPHYQWTVTPVVEYISQIKPSDVLSGRGGATNSHSGNRAFRALVKKYQDRYLRAKKRDKPAVASKIVEHVREKGGRFLRRVDTPSHGQILWVDIGDDRAREKTCQALREGAPELRRKRKASSSSCDDDDDDEDEEHAKRGGCYKGEDVESSSSIDRSATSGGEHEDSRNSPSKRTNFVSKASAHVETRDDAAGYDSQANSSSMIQPSSRLVQHRLVETISVEQLDANDRDLYLRDFVPPNPRIPRKQSNTKILHASSETYDTTSPDDSSGRWSSVQV